MKATTNSKVYALSAQIKGYETLGRELTPAEAEHVQKLKSELGAIKLGIA